MKFASRKSHQGSDSAITGGPLSGGVTDENYVDLAARFIETHGGEGFVIRSQEPKDGKRPTPAQWRAWMEYFADRRIKTTFARQHGIVTVPAEWPEDFDFTAPLSDRLWTPLAPLPADRAASVEERRENVKRFNALSERTFKPLPNDHRRRAPADHLASPRGPIDFAAPLSVSDELRASNAIRKQSLDEESAA